MATGACLVIFLALIAHNSLAEQVVFDNCPEPDDVTETSPAPAWNCTVHEVHISPCAEAAENMPCKIKRGKSASIQFDFTPDAGSAAVTGRAYWMTHGPLGDLPFVGMNTAACNHTECPLQPNHRQTYLYDLSISKKFPPRTYDVKWRLYNEDDHIDCCFVTKIKLVK